MSKKEQHSTKQCILNVSIDLFAEYGFKEVTMRKIAEKVGIKASSLYKHYDSKECIIKSIFDVFKEKIKQTELEIPQFKSPMEYFELAYEQFKKVMWEPSILKIMKIITSDHIYSSSVRELLINEMTVKPVQATKYVLDMMKGDGMIGNVDTQLLSEEYCAYIVYLVFEQNFLYNNPSIDLIDQKMKQHNDFFINYVLTKGEN